MKTAVINFPGTNCDHDMLYMCEKVMGWTAVEIWHEQTNLGGAELVVLPGGFAHGDYLRSGAIARFSPIMEAVKEHANSGGLTLGICNGFQMLCEAGLLPGALRQNDNMEYRSIWTYCKVQSTDSPFTQGMEPGDILHMPIGHAEGNYYAAPDVLENLNKNRQIVLRYCDAEGKISPESNPNGSAENIAGIINEGRNVMGLMPHPDRAYEMLIGGADGVKLLKALEQQYVNMPW